MKKLKLYLDTSVISYLFAEDTPEKMNDTLKLWDILKNNTEYEIYISNITAEELAECNEPKKTKMANMLKELEFILLEQNNEIENLSNEYINRNALSNKSKDDSMHIAFATLANCDLLLSWNFKHLVNYKTIKGIRIINFDNNLKELSIITPTMFIEGGDEDD